MRDPPEQIPHRSRLQRLEDQFIVPVGGQHESLRLPVERGVVQGLPANQKEVLATCPLRRPCRDRPGGIELELHPGTFEKLAAALDQKARFTLISATLSAAFCAR